MNKATKTSSPMASGKSLTQPIGGKKAAKFAEVEGMKMSVSAKALSQKVIAGGLKGDAYRREIAKSFKKA